MAERRQVAQFSVESGNVSALTLARGGFPEDDLPFSDGHIPLPPMPLVNRNTETEAVCALLRREDVRLLTITGPGGVGKTRLAIHVALVLQDEFPDGVRLVHLASVFQPGLFMTAVAHGLGFSAADEQSACQRLMDYFQEKQLLLVLDNFEQILGAAPGLTAWLDAAAGLKILVTSRARLRLSAEYEYPVPPMALPDLKSLPPPNELLARSPAVELFVKRLQAIRPAFHLNERNAPAVAEICVLLDGLPLALELAAARGKLLDPPALLERLRRFRPMGLLTGGAQDLPLRQQTIRRTMDWSYSLLGESERILFERLGVFMGGASLEGIESVCIEPGGLPILDSLQTLIDHSLIWWDESPVTGRRFQMLATLREYALERLEQRGEQAACRQRHAAYFETLVAQTIDDLRGPRQVETMHILEAELDNLRLALECCCTVPAGLEIGMRIASRLWEFWLNHGDIEEGQTWITRLLALPGAEAPTLERARMLNGFGIMSSPRKQDASPQLNESLSIFLDIGDKCGEAWVLNHLGQGELWRGDFKQARHHFEESLRLSRLLSQDWYTGWVYYNLAHLAIETGDLSLAETYIAQSLQLFLPLDDRRAIAWLYDASGDLERIPAAIQAYSKALEYSRQVGDPLSMARVTLSLGDALLRNDDTPLAAVYLQESLRLYQSIGELWGVGYALTGIAGIALKRGSAGQAASILGASSAYLEKADDFTRNYMSGFFSQVEQDVRHCLDNESYTRLWQEGRQTPAVILKTVMAWES